MPVPAIPKTDAPLVEIFSSIQGEGILVGARQIFIRFAGCNLDCHYCDTDFSVRSHCQVENSPGVGKSRLIANPVSGEVVFELIRDWHESAPGAHHSISLTGGEPLLQVDTLLNWLPELRKILPIYLETNGTLPAQLQTLLPFLDWVSMDIKLGSQTGLATDWEVHRRFLLLASQTNCYVKMVIGNDTSDLELQHGAELVAKISEMIPLILQPVTIEGGMTLGAVRLLQMQQLAAAIHGNVRVIPQTHRFIGVL